MTRVAASLSRSVILNSLDKIGTSFPVFFLPSGLLPRSVHVEGGFSPNTARPQWIGDFPPPPFGPRSPRRRPFCSHARSLIFWQLPSFFIVEAWIPSNLCECSWSTTFPQLLNDFFFFPPLFPFFCLLIDLKYPWCPTVFPPPFVDHATLAGSPSAFDSPGLSLFIACGRSWLHWVFPSGSQFFCWIRSRVVHLPVC